MKETKISIAIKNSSDPLFYKNEFEKCYSYFKDKGKYVYSVTEYFLKFIESDVKDDLLQRCVRANSIRGVTFEKLKLLYGDVGGSIRWESYKSKQAHTNTFEYKSQKYKMTKEEFDEYNKSRSVTLKNLIKRHGVEQGELLWNEYCTKQKTAGSSEEWFVRKYGEIEGKEKWKSANKAKGCLLDNYVKKYGEAGFEKYIEACENRSSSRFVSKISQKIFWEIFDYLTPDEKENCYFKELNKEFGKYCNNTKSYRYFDFVVTNIKLCIEYNGDFWHANPKIYKCDEYPNPYNKKLSASDIWEHDRIKNNIMIESGYKVFVIWESEYNFNTVKGIINDARINK